jgi:hypothetical protein
MPGLTEWPVPLLGRFRPRLPPRSPPEVIQLTMRTNQKYFALHQLLPGTGRGTIRRLWGGAPLRTVRPAPSVSPSGQPPPRPGEDWLPTSSASPIPTRPTAAPPSATATRKVLAARLADANFFWEQDLRVRSRSRRRSSTRSSSTKSWAPSPTRSSGWRSLQDGWWRRGSWVQIPLPQPLPVIPAKAGIPLLLLRPRRKAGPPLPRG